MAGEQAEIFDDGIDIGGREIWVGGAGKMEDLFNDPVQVFHFFAHDLDIASARIVAFETEIERMEEHLDDGKRIANFMRDFGGEEAESGKFFIGAKLFFDIDDAFIEAGFFNGDAGELSQRGEDADFFVRETVRFGGVNVESANRCATEEQGNAEQRDGVVRGARLRCFDSAKKFGRCRFAAAFCGERRRRERFRRR